MSELVVLGFESAEEADRLLTRLGRMQREYLIDLEDSVVAIRDDDGRVRLKQSISMVARGTSYGLLSGGIWGSLIGLLFLNPLAGFALGGAVGAGVGALSGSLADYGINDDFMRELGATLKPGTSALFLLLRKAQPEKVLAEIEGLNAHVIRTSLSPEQETRLQAALAQRQEDQLQGEPHVQTPA